MSEDVRHRAGRGDPAVTGAESAGEGEVQGVGPGSSGVQRAPADVLDRDVDDREVTDGGDATRALREERLADDRSPGDETDDDAREGLTVEARSLWQLFRRRFFRHKLAVTSLVVFVLLALSGLFAEQIAPYSFEEIDLINRDMGPTTEGLHFFGTDRLGRDYFSRVLYGIGTSVQVAVIVAVVSTAIGTIVGAIAGYYRGWVDNALMRVVDTVLTIPFLAALLVLSTFIGGGNPYFVALIIASLIWTTIARVVRGEFLSLREKEFVEAARASGASDARIIFRHMLPNTVGPIIVNATLITAIAILLEATLSYLGFGVQPPTPALGKLINDGQGSMLTQWWLVAFPGLAIVLLCLCINFVGDGLRDALDPKQAEK